MLYSASFCLTELSKDIFSFLALCVAAIPLFVPLALCQESKPNGASSVEMWVEREISHLGQKQWRSFWENGKTEWHVFLNSGKVFAEECTRPCRSAHEMSHAEVPANSKSSIITSATGRVLEIPSFSEDRRLVRYLRKEGSPISVETGNYVKIVPFGDGFLVIQDSSSDQYLSSELLEIRWEGKDINPRVDHRLSVKSRFQNAFELSDNRVLIVFRSSIVELSPDIDEASITDMPNWLDLQTDSMVVSDDKRFIFFGFPLFVGQFDRLHKVFKFLRPPTSSGFSRAVDRARLHPDDVHVPNLKAPPNSHILQATFIP